MSNVFQVPCPACSHPMSVCKDGDVECAGCERRYHARMGHLFPVAERQPGGLAESAATHGP